MTLSRFFTWLFTLVLATSAAVSLAQSEPTVDQIYKAANSGEVSKAQDMIDQVLRSHPNSAKAHYVKAELAARELDGPTAKQSLAKAEQFAPGLPFAKPESVQALRTQVDRLGRAPAPKTAATARDPRGDARTDSRQLGNTSAASPQKGPEKSFPWGMLAIGALAVFGVIAFMRSRAAARANVAGGIPAGMHGSMQGGAVPTAGPFGGPGAPSGAAGGPAAGYPPGSNPPGSYPPGAYPAQQPGMGSTLGRGLATGLAVGAGVVAAQEIGRRMMDNGQQPSPLSGPNPDGGFVDPSGLDGIANADMGGQNFGVNDPGSWDDAGGGGIDSGGDGGGSWDN